MDFCNICVNMLYTKVDEEKNLVNYCKNCLYEEIVTSTESKLIINSLYDDKNNFNLHLNKYIKYDPTIPKVNNITCLNSKCSKEKDQDNNILVIKYDNINLKYVYFCCYCDYYWNNDTKIKKANKEEETENI